MPTDVAKDYVKDNPCSRTVSQTEMEILEEFEEPRRPWTESRIPHAHTLSTPLVHHAVVHPVLPDAKKKTQALLLIGETFDCACLMYDLASLVSKG